MSHKHHRNVRWTTRTVYFYSAQKQLRFAALWSSFAPPFSWKLIETNKTLLIELFDLRADPAEERNVASKFPGVVRELRERLAEWKSNQTDHVISDRGEVELSDDRIEKLKSLGYLQ